MYLSLCFPFLFHQFVCLWPGVTSAFPVAAGSLGSGPLSSRIEQCWAVRLKHRCKDEELGRGEAWCTLGPHFWVEAVLKVSLVPQRGDPWEISEVEVDWGLAGRLEAHRFELDWPGSRHLASRLWQITRDLRPRLELYTGYLGLSSGSMLSTAWSRIAFL